VGVGEADLREFIEEALVEAETRSAAEQKGDTTLILTAIVPPTQTVTLTLTPTVTSTLALTAAPTPTLILTPTLTVTPTRAVTLDEASPTVHPLTHAASLAPRQCWTSLEAPAWGAQKG